MIAGGDKSGDGTQQHGAMRGLILRMRFAQHRVQRAIAGP